LTESLAILIGGIFALIELVVAALLDFFRREPKYRYDVYSRADSQRMFWLFLGVTLCEWAMILLLQLLILPEEIGWPIYAICVIGKMVLFQKDFLRRRKDVPNTMFRMSQYNFLIAAVALVGVSYYVHSRPTTKPS